MGSLAHFNDITETIDHLEVTQPLKVVYNYDLDSAVTFQEVHDRGVYTRTATQSGRYVGLSLTAARECVAWINTMFTRKLCNYTDEMTQQGLKDIRRRTVTWPTATITPNATWYDVNWSISDSDSIAKDVTGTVHSDPSTTAKIKEVIFRALPDAGIPGRKYFNFETESAMTSLLPATASMGFDGATYETTFDSATYSYVYNTGSRTVTELVINKNLVGYTLFPEDSSSKVVDGSFDFNAHKGETVTLRSSDRRFIRLDIGGLI